MLNTIILSGRLTKDPELRYTQAQKPVASFTVACERDYNPQGGSRETDFIDCVAWNGTADFVDKWFHKGSMVSLVGRLQSRDWQDRDGRKHRNWEINVERVYFGESKKSGDEDSYARTEREGRYEPAGRGVDAGPSAFSELEAVDGQLPF